MLADDGTLFFDCFLDLPAICTATSVIVDTDDIIDGKRLFAPRAVAVNRRGEVAYVANYIGGQGIFTTQQGLVVGTGDVVDHVPFFAPTGGVSVNRFGRLAFQAAPTAQLEQNGIYALPQFIIGVGEVLEGHRLALIGSPALNDRGEVVFYARFGEAALSAAQTGRSSGQVASS